MGEPGYFPRSQYKRNVLVTLSRIIQKLEIQNNIRYNKTVKTKQIVYFGLSSSFSLFPIIPGCTKTVKNFKHPE